MGSPNCVEQILFETACGIGAADTVHFKFKRNLSSSVKIKITPTALLNAAAFGHTDLLAWLLDRYDGVDKNEYDENTATVVLSSMFKCACANGHLATAAWLSRLYAARGIAHCIPLECVDFCANARWLSGARAAWLAAVCSRGYRF